VLADFGRAKVIGKAGFSTTMFVGHISYMAPELLPPDDSDDIDELFSKKSDIYAFGMLCFEVSRVIMGNYIFIMFYRPSQIQLHFRPITSVGTSKFRVLSTMGKDQGQLVMCKNVSLRTCGGLWRLVGSTHRRTGPRLNKSYSACIKYSPRLPCLSLSVRYLVCSI
jgi:serine/threonine protein kinase